jgi:hypothetical protein
MTEEQNQEITDEEALMKIAQAMKDNVPSAEDKVNVHTFLRDVVTTPDTTRVANLRDDKDLNELGIPNASVRGSKEMARISRLIMNNEFFADFFDKESADTTDTSLSREGFIVRQATVQTKQVADITKRRKINKGWFGKQTVDEQGGDTTQSSN